MPKTSTSSKEDNKNYKDHTDLWETYRNKYDITKRQYRDIVEAFFTILGYNMVNEGKIYRLPFGLSTIGVYKVPTFGRGYFDYQHFKETGQKVYKKNLHSEQ